MRQNPLYYLIYCALRPDQNVNLVTYLYYVKYTYKGDSTFFRYIDINVKDLIRKDRGACIIQDSVSLDDEFKDDCIVILPEMHKHIKK